MADKLDLIPITEWGFFTLPRPMVIAGPCAAESEAQLMETAKGLASFGIHVFRAGIWKPRTHPGSFEGIGMPGLKCFVAAVFGGIGSIPGAVIGAFIIGICENIIKGMGWTTFSDAFTFALLIVILLVKPTGLFGEKATDKV